MSGEKLFRARIVWPISHPPIEDGAVHIRDGLIVEVGSWGELSLRAGAAAGVTVEDLGEVALLPGLVNAHCHLDYTNMAGKIASPAGGSGAFGDWIKGILALKAHWSYTEYADSWVKGAHDLLASGVTTVADIEAVPELLPDVWDATPLRMISLLEMTGVRSGHEPMKIFLNAMAFAARIACRSDQRNRDRKQISFSPHALYSTPPALLFQVGKHLQAGNFVGAIHLAESQAEWEMYQNASGPLYDWLKHQRPMDDCGGRSPIEQAHRLGILQRGLLVVHANYLGPQDAKLLVDSGSSVVHCPQSHDYFRHARFDYEELARAGVNICLGTDSLASAGSGATLNLWDEMRVFAKNYPAIAPQRILEMATVNGAQALQLPVGALEAGCLADMIAVDVSAGSIGNVAEALVQGRPNVAKRFIAGDETGGL